MLVKGDTDNKLIQNEVNTWLIYTKSGLKLD